jgi:hypothetical protein
MRSQGPEIRFGNDISGCCGKESENAARRELALPDLCRFRPGRGPIGQSRNECPVGRASRRAGFEVLLVDP